MTGHISWAYDEITPEMRTAKPGLLLRARKPGYILEWYCMPPVPGRRFRIMDSEITVEGDDVVWRINRYEEVNSAGC